MLVSGLTFTVMKTAIAEKPVVFNFKSEKLTISPADVPTLVPATVMSELQKGDAEPYFKLQALKFPVEGSGVYPARTAIYTQEFFESFLAVCKQRPIPGSKRGHEWASRPATDFYLVGGKVEGANGKGTVYFKNYVPPDGDTTPNAGLIRDMKAGMVHFSLVTMPKYVTEGEEQRFIGSAGHERNDAIEYGAGAMKQTTNAGANPAELLSESVDRAEKLINAGKHNAKSSWTFTAFEKAHLLGRNADNWEGFAQMHLARVAEGDPHSRESYLYPIGKNGTVYRSALRTVASRAANAGHEEVAAVAADLITLMDEQRRTHNRRPNMEREELLQLLANMKANGELTLNDVADAMGPKAQIVTDDHLKAVKLVNDLTALGVTDPIEEIKAMQNKLVAVDSDRVKNALDAAFGPEKDKEGKENTVRSYAGTMTANVKASEIDEKIVALKEDAVMKRLAADRADFTSPENELGIVENRPDSDGTADGPVVVEY